MPRMRDIDLVVASNARGRILFMEDILLNLYANTFCFYIFNYHISLEATILRRLIDTSLVLQQLLLAVNSHISFDVIVFELLFITFTRNLNNTIYKSKVCMRDKPKQVYCMTY